jgi:hypothetical protein
MKTKVKSGLVHLLDFGFDAQLTWRGKYNKLGGREQKGVL